MKKKKFEREIFEKKMKEKWSLNFLEIFSKFVTSILLEKERRKERRKRKFSNK